MSDQEQKKATIPRKNIRRKKEGDVSWLASYNRDCLLSRRPLTRKGGRRSEYNKARLTRMQAEIRETYKGVIVLSSEIHAKRSQKGGSHEKVRGLESYGSYQRVLKTNAPRTRKKTRGKTRLDRKSSSSAAVVRMRSRERASYAHRLPRKTQKQRGMSPSTKSGGKN